MTVLFILLSSGFSIALGIMLDHGSGGTTSSYRAVYYGARCIIDHADPYDPNEFLRVYHAESNAVPSEPVHKHLFLRAVMVCVNLPTTLFLVLPLALIPWGPSHIIWLAMIAVTLTLAAILVFDLASDKAPTLSLVLICLFMANSEVLFTVGNTAGLAVGLCIIAVWCFIRRRFALLGVLALAISLALKPHDSGLVWLWLLFSGGLLRKRALQSALLVVLIAVPAILTTSHVSPHWSAELASNLSATSSHGDISDPGPDSISRKGSADVVIDLQTALSLFRDDPRFYNPAAYLICGSLLALWLIFTLRLPHSESHATRFLALAALAALTMLASYHRPYDAKLLLLAIPALSMLWSEGHPFRRTALVVTILAMTLTSDLPLAIISILTRGINVSVMGMPSKILLVCVLRPAPLALLAMAALYLWIHIRAVSVRTPELTLAERGSR
jgi:hypothetical protein